MRLGKCMYSRAWIRNPHRNTSEYIQGVRYFMKFAKYHSSPHSEICSCPCKKCRNAKKFDFQTVQKHLIIHGMDPRYDKWFFHGESDRADAVEFKDDSIVEAPDKKKSYSSGASAKQVKVPLATKSNANQIDGEGLLLRMKDNHNQLKELNSILQDMCQSLQQVVQQAVQQTLKTEASCSTKNSFIGNQNDNSVASGDEVESSSNEKQYVMLLSQNLEEVAKGFLRTCTKYDGLEVAHDEEKIVCLTEVFDPEAPVFDGPQNGKYKLREIGDGGNVIWARYRLRFL